MSCGQLGVIAEPVVKATVIVVGELAEVPGIGAAGAPWR